MAVHNKFPCWFKRECSKSAKARLFLLVFMLICQNVQVFVDCQQNHHHQDEQYPNPRVFNMNNNNNRVNRVADGQGHGASLQNGHGMSWKSSPSVSTGWDSQPQPLKFNYQILPAPASSHGWSGGSEAVEHGESHVSHGWGEKGEGEEEEEHEDKLDGKDLLKTIFAIKALKAGKYLVLGKLLLLVMILAAIAKAGTVLSPIALPLFALPIIIAAALLFKPLLFVGFFIVAFLSVLKEGKGKKKGGKHGHHNMNMNGWGWAKRRYTRSNPASASARSSDLDFDLEEIMTNILTRIETSPLFLYKNTQSQVW